MMTQEERQAAEAVIRSSCARYGEAVVSAILAKVQRLPDTEDRHAFAARVGDIVGAEVRAWLTREQAAVANVHAGLDAMSVMFPRGPVGVS